MEIIIQLSMALFLGMRHGLDLDHLATIDSITRTAPNRQISKFAGMLFSFGHGLVVITISLIIGSGIANLEVPNWLNNFGNAISVIFLFLFGILTLWGVWNNSASNVVLPSIKRLLFNNILCKKSKDTEQQDEFNVLYIVLIGALFALSFDTFSQVALFSLSAKAMAGGFFAAILGIFFMLGMMASDGINGYLIANILQRADRFSIMFSKLAGLIIACFSLTICIINLNKLISYA